MADLSERRDDLEACLALRVLAGDALWGLYPPSEVTREKRRQGVMQGWPAIAEVKPASNA